jgi:hypothetical protein
MITGGLAWRVKVKPSGNAEKSFDFSDGISGPMTKYWKSVQ